MHFQAGKHAPGFPYKECAFPTWLAVPHTARLLCLCVVVPEAYQNDGCYVAMCTQQHANFEMYLHCCKKMYTSHYMDFEWWVDT